MVLGETLSEIPPNVEISVYAVLHNIIVCKTWHLMDSGAHGAASSVDLFENLLKHAGLVACAAAVVAGTPSALVS
jgi:hypothetical protein